MAQLRHDYPKFRALQTEVLVIVPNGPRMIERFVREHHIPYPILTDKGSVVAAQYGIKIKKAVWVTALKPCVFLVDQAGKIRYFNYLKSYIQEPDNREPLAVLEEHPKPLSCKALR
jgi:peroxiredoxin